MNPFKLKGADIIKTITQATPFGKVETIISMSPEEAALYKESLKNRITSLQTSPFSLANMQTKATAELGFLLEIMPD